MALGGEFKQLDGTRAGLRSEFTLPVWSKKTSSREFNLNGLRWVVPNVGWQKQIKILSGRPSLRPRLTKTEDAVDCKTDADFIGVTK